MSDNYNQGGAPQASQSNGMAVASLVLGILSILFGWIPIIGLVSWILAPLGLVLSVLAMNKSASKGLAIAGVVCSSIGLLICILWVVGLGALVTAGAASGY